MYLQCVYNINSREVNTSQKKTVMVVKYYKLFLGCSLCVLYCQMLNLWHWKASLLFSMYILHAYMEAQRADRTMSLLITVGWPQERSQFGEEEPLATKRNKAEIGERVKEGLDWWGPPASRLCMGVHELTRMSMCAKMLDRWAVLSPAGRKLLQRSLPVLTKFHPQPRSQNKKRWQKCSGLPIRIVLLVAPAQRPLRLRYL